MSLIASILVPLDGSAQAARGLGVGSWLATRLGARLHVLNAGTAEPRPELLARLKVPEKYHAVIELHQAEGEAAKAILAALVPLHVGLLVISGYGETSPSAAPDPSHVLGHVSRQVIEDCRIPVLVLPPAYEELLPWHSLLVALSGEAAKDEVLAFALQLAQALDVRVSVAHVVESGVTAEAGTTIVDAPHHELAERLNELVACACPTCSPQERSRIVDFHLAHGEVASELVQLTELKQTGALVVGWRGQFMQGRAQILKALMSRVRCPVLLMQPHPKAPFRLKVGEALG